MIRNESALSYNKKALLAAGAAVGLGLITYRLWSGRRRQTTVDRVQQPKIDASSFSKVGYFPQPLVLLLKPSLITENVWLTTGQTS